MPKKQAEDEGLPEWFATFADMMTLLMTFFVLLFSMSSLDPVKMADMAANNVKNMTEAEKKKQQKAPKKSQRDILDEVEAKIEEEKMEEFAKVERSTKGISITIDSRFAFESGSADLRSAIYPFLNSVIPIMSDEGNRFPIAVEGHTDNFPIPPSMAARFPTNWELSASRAASVVRYCIERGVPAMRFRATGYADRIPYGSTWTQIRLGISDEMVRAKNSTSDLQSQNRRVEITFLASG